MDLTQTEQNLLVISLPFAYIAGVIVYSNMVDYFRSKRKV